MDVFELLTNDHRKVSAIFEQLEQTSDVTTRQTLFAQVKQELDLHAYVEETLFYPKLKEAAETREIILEAYEEHQEVKDLLTEMQGLSPDGDEWSDLLQELKESVEHHVDEEENEMFPQAREVLSASEIDQLGTQIEAAKQQQKQKASSAAPSM
ncbi:MAG: hemerythrin domain-containing protein [Pyrinomonadaceae bacterium]|nr:hemerythrin domain-containing protein [Pyrinomonadaceae bacterium]